MGRSGERPAAPSGAATVAPLGWYPWYVAVLLALAGALAYLDRQVMGLLTEPVKNDLKLTDVQVSMLQSLAFILFYAIMAFPLGYLSDRWPRRTLIGVGIFLWSIATAFCGFAKSFVMLFLARMGVGIGEASLLPASQSLLPDYFDPVRLPRAFAIFQTGLYIGGGTAYVLGGLILAIVSDWTVSLPFVGLLQPWQWTFIMFALPGPIIALLMWTVREPRRLHNPALRDAADESVGFGAFLRSRWVFLVAHLGSAATLGLMGHGIVSWTPSFFIRSFGWTASQVGMIYGAILVVFGGSGTMIGGYLAQRWTRQKVTGAPARVVILACLLVAPSAIAYPLVGSTTVALICLAVFSFALGVSSAMTPTVLQLTTPRALRGRMGSIYVFATTAVGAALGPVVIAAVTDYILHDTQRLRESIAIVCVVAAPLAIALSLLAYREFSRLTRPLV